MTDNELGMVLKEMYENAPHGDKAAMIHLFGIKYADEIRNGDYSLKYIVKVASLPESYRTEISKGMNISKYVIVK